MNYRIRNERHNIFPINTSSFVCLYTVVWLRCLKCQIKWIGNSEHVKYTHTLVLVLYVFARLATNTEYVCVCVFVWLYGENKVSAVLPYLVHYSTLQYSTVCTTPYCLQIYNKIRYFLSLLTICINYRLTKTLFFLSKHIFNMSIIRGKAEKQLYFVKALFHSSNIHAYYLI